MRRSKGGGHQLPFALGRTKVYEHQMKIDKHWKPSDQDGTKVDGYLISFDAYGFWFVKAKTKPQMSKNELARAKKDSS